MFILSINFSSLYLNFYYTNLCVYLFRTYVVCVMCVGLQTPQITRGDRRTICPSQSSSSSIWIPGVNSGHQAWRQVRLADQSSQQPRFLNHTPLLLLVVFDEYKRISQKDIEQSIKSETSGSFEDALLAIGKLVSPRTNSVSVLP